MPPQTDPEAPTGGRAPKKARPRGWSRPTRLGLTLAVIGILATLIAWLWPRSPPNSSPPLYAIRVQVLDPDGRPVDGSTVRASAGNEPQLLPAGWWEIEIAGAKVPMNRRVTAWAEHARWETTRTLLNRFGDGRQLEAVSGLHILG